LLVRLEDALKLSKTLLAISLLCLGTLALVMPAWNIAAQDTGATPTPEILIITATPSGSTDTTITVGTEPPTDTGSAPAATPDAAGTPVPREVQARRLAFAALGKKLGKRISYVKNWTWELKLFGDSALGCPAEGQTATKGDNAGYLITVTDFDSKVYELHVTYDLSKTYYCSSVGTTQAASLPQAVAGKAVGGTFEAGAQIYDFGNSTVARLKTAKMKWIKVQVSPSDNSAQGRINAAHGQGFKILLSVKGSASEVLNAGFFDQFASYVGAVAAQGADAIEVWNEQNIDREWPAGHIDPAQYTQLLAKSYNAIKAANGNTIVVSGALSPTGFFGAGGKADAGWNDDVYYQGMAAAGAGQYMDCVGLHYNEGVVSPTQGSGDPRDNYPTRYFDSMLARAIGPFAGKQGCFTEIGYLTPQGYPALPGAFAWGQNTSVAQQAQWLAEAAVKSAQSGNVRLMIVFNMDFVRYDADPQAGYAMIRPDGTCPACDKMGQVLQ
jgi:hypothetical protein